MPIKKCKTKTNKTGFKYGDSGKCYSDRNKAVKQGQAIKISQNKKKDK